MTEEEEEEEVHVFTYRFTPIITDTEFFEDNTDPDFLKKCEDIANSEFKKDKDIIDDFIEHLKEAEEAEE